MAYDPAKLVCVSSGHPAIWTYETTATTRSAVSSELVDPIVNQRILGDGDVIIVKHGGGGIDVLHLSIATRDADTGAPSGWTLSQVAALT